MKVRSVAILIFDDVEVLDFAGPYEVFSRTRLEAGVASRRNDDTAPFRVFTVAETEDPVRAVGGLSVNPDYSFALAPAADVLVVPGGFGTRALMNEPPTLSWIAATAERAELVTSVCTGALLLGSLGLLGGKRATTHWAALDELQAVDSSIEVLGNCRYVDDGVITSAGVSAGIEMSFYVVEKLVGEGVADETAHYIEYRRAGSAR